MTAGCKYPLWGERDPSTMEEGEFRYCGAECLEGSSYCARHEARCRGDRPLPSVTIPEAA